MPMDMKECWKYRYGVEWDDCEMRDTKLLWVMVWDHSKDYYTRIHEVIKPPMLEDTTQY